MVLYKSVHPYAYDKSSLSIGSVKKENNNTVLAAMRTIDLLLRVHC